MKFCEHFQSVLYLHDNVSIDEGVVKWQGHWKKEQYNENNPDKCHVKILAYVDSNKLSTQFLAYYSSDTNYADEVANLGQIEKTLSLEAVRRSSPRNFS